jgi:hypothetical protein
LRSFITVFTFNNSGISENHTTWVAWWFTNSFTNCVLDSVLTPGAKKTPETCKLNETWDAGLLQIHSFYLSLSHPYIHNCILCTAQFLQEHWDFMNAILKSK